MIALAYLAVGAIVLFSTWMPLVLRNRPLSLPMLAVGIGAAAAMLLGNDHSIVPFGPLAEHVTAVVLLLAVYGAGLRVDQPLSLTGWRTTGRLLFLVMPLSIGLIALLAWWLLGLPLGLAVLMGAILAPTDPVLAGEVQLGPPGRGPTGQARFGLTTEAGLNDGLAMPFVILGLAIQSGDIVAPVDLLEWGVLELLGKPIGGAVLGIAIGVFIVAIDQQLPRRMRLSASRSGLAGIALAFLTYGLATALGVNGFIAAFCETVAVRAASREEQYARRVVHATEQAEHSVMSLVMIAFGFGLPIGLLVGLEPVHVLFAILVLLVVRPATTWLGLLGSSETKRTRAAFSYFGIKGLGSIYYAAYVLVHHPPDWGQALVPATAVTVLVSVVLYGVSGPIMIRRLVSNR